MLSISCLIAAVSLFRPQLTVQKLPLDGVCFSGDGLVIGGSLDRRPYLWSASGLQKLELPHTFTAGAVSALSRDGKIAVGTVSDAQFEGIHKTAMVRRTKSRACLWKDGVCMLICPGRNSRAMAVSSDGKTVIGNCDDVPVGTPLDSHDNLGRNTQGAFRWRENSGLESLASADRSLTSRALGCSSNGSIVVGLLYDAWRGGSSLFASTSFGQACYWDATGNLTKLLTDAPADQQVMTEADGCSPDGRTIVGQARWKAFLRWEAEIPSKVWPTYKKAHYTRRKGDWRDEIQPIPRNMVAWTTRGVEHGMPNPNNGGPVNRDPSRILKQYLEGMDLVVAPTGPFRIESVSDDAKSFLISFSDEQDWDTPWLLRIRDEPPSNEGTMADWYIRPISTDSEKFPRVDPYHRRRLSGLDIYGAPIIFRFGENDFQHRRLVQTSSQGPSSYLRSGSLMPPGVDLLGYSPEGDLIFNQPRKRTGAPN
ncbi:MAG TPA: hypothetical protein VG944_20995 [Fimbriimonas sp.]|nr:hypothetical protein [Fimbriimonas sp.]